MRVADVFTTNGSWTGVPGAGTFTTGQGWTGFTGHSTIDWRGHRDLPVGRWFFPDGKGWS